jgi:hypothetical protein
VLVKLGSLKRSEMFIKLVIEFPDIVVVRGGLAHWLQQLAGSMGWITRREDERIIAAVFRAKPAISRG